MAQTSDNQALGILSPGLLWHACPPWCVGDWADMDPGTRYHHGPARAVGGYEVNVERFDDENTLAGEVRVHISQPREALTLATARLLALALLDAVAEGEQR
jgi:hypothetical protein